MNSGQKIQTISANKLGVAALAFSRDGRWLLTGGQETPFTGSHVAVPNPVVVFGIKLWNTSTWKEQKVISFPRYGAPIAAFSPDGHRFALEKDWDVIELYDVDRGTRIGTLTARDPRSHDRPYSSGNLAFSPDGALLLQAAQNGIRVWKLTPPGE